jgi:hypothetical protein
MGGPLTVVVLVAAGGAAEPTTMAIERAASEALGHVARVVVRESAGAPTDGEALSIASEANEGAVVEVTWNDRGHRVAMLRVHLAGRRRWTDRTIGFGAGDADPERGRTIGLALASMLPDPDPVPSPPAPPPPAPPEAAPPPSRRVVPLAIVPERESPDEISTSTSSSTPVELRYAMDVFGLAAAGLGGDVQAAGGGAALETFLTPWLALRIGGGVRAADLAGARARTLTLLATAGVELHPWPVGSSRAFSVALRTDYVLMNQTVTHFSTTGEDLSTMARALSGVDALIEMEWRLGEKVDLLAGAGVEDMLATTYVDVNGARLATLPPLSAIGEVGLRGRF